jgi:RimJ/RimL family protein N-acetyltransferase
MIILETERLILRTWQESDLQPMFEINQDPKVMGYFPSLQDLQTTKNFIAKISKHYDKYGYSLYVVELKATGEMIGFVGLLHRTKAEFDAPFMPATEIGWRLSSKHWNKGYATEAARAVLEYGFTQLGLDEIVSFTVVNNKPSRRVMEKIGFHHNPKDDFDHTKLEADSPLCRHVLYRLSKLEHSNHHITNHIGQRVNITIPLISDMKTFLHKVNASKLFHRQWVNPPASQEEYENYILRISQENQCGYFLRLHATGEIIGVININEIVKGCFQSAYLGYYLFSTYSEKGLMKEGLHLVIQHAFTKLGLHRLEANIQPDNTSSVKLIQSLGFRHEGFSPKYLRINERWCDHERFAITKEEYIS